MSVRSTRSKAPLLAQRTREKWGTRKSRSGVYGVTSYTTPKPKAPPFRVVP